MHATVVGHSSSSMDTPDPAYEVLIVGGGILGLSTALMVHERRPHARICLLEKEQAPALHQSGRNSGVLHSGIYYAPGSLKAALCLAGYKRMRAFCAENHLPLQVSGKLIVASDASEEPRLRLLFERGLQHGLNVTWLDGEQAREIEPYVECHAAIHVPETALVDFSSVCRTLLENLRGRNVDVRLATEFRRADTAAGGFYVQTSTSGIATRAIINCAGLQCDRVAGRAGARIPGRIIPFRGDFYHLRPERAHLVKSMIYPVPDERFPFLGVHFTRSVNGGVHVGPNAVLSLAREGYSKLSFSPGDAFSTCTFPGFWRFTARHLATGLREMQGAFIRSSFAQRARKLIPSLHTEDLVPARSGIRAQALDPSGALVEDFSIVRRGNAWHVFNAPSPAATSSFAIAEKIATEVMEAIA
jgi:L-2-hydroxyglutarate oxidase